jgi:hypothetical protein
MYGLERAARAALCVLLFAAAPLEAQYRGLSLGLGGEMNLISLWENRGYGASFTAEGRLNRWFALAFTGGASLRNNSSLADISGGRAFIAA